MTVNIEISDNYRITSDSTQIIVQHKHLVDPTLSPAYDADKHSSETRVEWRNWKYCGKVSQAIEIIARQNVFESDATSLEQLRNEIALFRREIKRAMGEDDKL